MQLVVEAVRRAAGLEVGDGHGPERFAVHAGERARHRLPNHLFYIHIRICFMYISIYICKIIYTYVYICIYVCTYKTMMVLRSRLEVVRDWSVSTEKPIVAGHGPEHFAVHAGERARHRLPGEREFFTDNLLVRIHSTLVDRPFAMKFYPPAQPPVLT